MDLFWNKSWKSYIFILFRFFFIHHFFYDWTWILKFNIFITVWVVLLYEILYVIIKSWNWFINFNTILLEFKVLFFYISLNIEKDVKEYKKKRIQSLCREFFLGYNIVFILILKHSYIWNNSWHSFSKSYLFNHFHIDKNFIQKMNLPINHFPLNNI